MPLFEGQVRSLVGRRRADPSGKRGAPLPYARTYILLDSTTPDALGRLQRLDKLLDALTHEDGWSAPTSVRGRHYQTVEHVREE